MGVRHHRIGGEMTGETPNVLVAAVSSDIGRELALMYRARGWGVIGTYRDEGGTTTLRNQSGIDLVQCDISRPESIGIAADAIQELGKPWDLFIGAVGQL